PSQRLIWLTTPIFGFTLCVGRSVLVLATVAMKSGYQLVTLANGGTSVHSSHYGETFHPVIGPVAEAEALYVNQLRLRERLQHFSGEFVIWDIGLGAAANALTVLRATRDLSCAI